MVLILLILLFGIAWDNRKKMCHLLFVVHLMSIQIIYGSHSINTAKPARYLAVIRSPKNSEKTTDNSLVIITGGDLRNGVNGFLTSYAADSVRFSQQILDKELAGTTNVFMR